MNKARLRLNSDGRIGVVVNGAEMNKDFPDETTAIKYVRGMVVEGYPYTYFEITTLDGEAIRCPQEVLP